MHSNTSIINDMRSMLEEWSKDYNRIGYDGREQHENDFMMGTIIPELYAWANRMEDES